MSDVGRRVSDEQRERLLERLRSRAVAAAASDRPHPGPRPAILPLSSAQERLWVLDRFAPGLPVYHLALALELDGPLDRGALERALAAVVRRHEILRTAFAAPEGVPEQVVLPLPELEVRYEDLSGRSEATSEGRRAAAAEAARPFDLERGVPLRLLVLRLAESRHLCVLTIHHIVGDAESVRIVADELAACYRAEVRGEPVAIPPADLQYADYAIWQRERERDDAHQRHLAYWVDRLSGAPGLELPGDRPRPALQTFRGSMVSRDVAPAVAHALGETARRLDCTPYMVLVAGFQALLHRYTGSEDVVVGSAHSGRHLPEVRGLLGPLVNVLVLRADLSGRPTGRELIARARDAVLDAFEHREVPFEQLVSKLKVERDPSRNPLFQLVLTLQPSMEGPPDLEGLRVHEVELVSETARFDLSLNVERREGGLRLIAEYSTDLFDGETIERLLGHYERMLAALAAGLDTLVADLDYLAPEEREQLVRGWNRTARPYDRRCVHELFREQARRTPDAIAVCPERGDPLTYAALNAGANRLAHRLLALGVAREERVCVCLERGAGLVTALLAVLKAGGAFCPLDPAFPVARLRFMLADTGARVVVAAPEQRELFRAEGVEVVGVDEHGELPDTDPELRTLAGALAYVIYTSGSTGLPKGVAIEHHSVANLVAVMRDEFTVGPADRVLKFSSPSFDVSILETFLPLLTGARICMPTRDTALSPTELSAFMETHGVTFVDIAPVMMALMQGGGFPSLRVALVGGEPFSSQLVRDWSRPGRRFVNGYGPTEATVTMTLYDCRPDAEEASPPIGRPTPNHRCYVLDRQLRPVPAGVPGELCIGGVGLTRGYLGRPGLTADRLVPEPWAAEPGSRMYRSGDLARFRADGEIEFLGRVDRQVKVRGFRVEPAEIEKVLLGHAAIRQVAVEVREPETGRKQLVAYVGVEPGSRPTIGELRGYLSERLPAYMVPNAFQVMDQLPVTRSGKVDRDALPEPDPGRPDLGTEFVAARSDTESLLANAIFSTVLKVDQVGVNDNFFDLGGNSLQAAQVVSRVRESFSVDLPLRTLFQAPTIADLARTIEARTLAERVDDTLLDEIEGLTDEEVERELERDE